MRRTRTTAWPPSRVHSRVRADLRVRVAIFEQSIPRMIHARLNDISRGGANVLMPRELPDGSHAVIGLRDPRGDGRYLWFRSRLRHRAGFRCGFEFLDINPEQKSLLRELCLE